MSDKVQKIKEEIERRIEKYGPDFKTPYDAMYQLLTLLDFIDSLPEDPASEDLEEEITNFFSDWLLDSTQYKKLPNIARHFAEWQKNKDLEDSLKSDMTMPNKFYEKGKRDILKSLPKWKKATEYKDFEINEACILNDDIYPIIATNVNIGEYYLELDELKNLPLEE